MVTRRIVIKFEASGARTVQANIAGVGKAAKGASKETDSLKNALKALIALETARRILNLADSFTLLTNRLRVLTKDSQQLVATQNALFDVSKRTRTPIELNALLFQRLSLATQGLAKNQGEVLQVVETLNKAIRISGTTTQEASAGLIQLAQGFAFGALRGDELRSVMEQLPVISRLLEKELKVTRGELRELGKEGKITSDILLSAITNATEEINAQFEGINITVGETLVNLRTEFIRVIGKLDEATGATKTLGEAVIFLTENLEAFLKGGAIAAVALLAGTLVAAIAGASSFIALISASAVGGVALFAAGIGGLVTVIVAATGALIFFNREIRAFFSENEARLQEVEREAAKDTKRRLKNIALQEAALEAQALATSKVITKISELRDKLKEEADSFKLSREEREETIELEKALGNIKLESLDIGNREIDEKLKLSKIDRIRRNQLKEEDALVARVTRKERERTAEIRAARRAERRSLLTKEQLLAIERQQFTAVDKTILKMKQEVLLLNRNAAAAQILSVVQSAANALAKEDVDLRSDKAKAILAEVQAQAIATRSAELRRQNLIRFKIDNSETEVVLRAVGAILDENADKLEVRTKILKELTVEQAKFLLQENQISETEFGKVIEESIAPLREEIDLLKEETKNLALGNEEARIRTQIKALEIELLQKLGPEQQQRVNDILAEAEATIRSNNAAKERAQILEDLGVTNIEGRERARALNEVLAEGNLSLDQRVKLMLMLNEATATANDFGKGLVNQFLAIDTTLLKFGEDIGGFLVGAIEKAADALADFAVEGFQDTEKLKQAFSDLFQQLAKDLVAATIKLLIFKAIQTGLDFAFGGAGSTAAAAGSGGGGAGPSLIQQALPGVDPKFLQSGGFLQAGQPALVGERGPEPFVPTTSGRVLPNNALGETPAPQVTVVNVTDPEEIQQFLSTTEGEDVIMNVIQKRNRQVRGLLK